ncbi:MAG: hypothetical protein A2904_01150 [Candidatus Staskawiczbacteria bacterium RIFCSPLOWO2_01_FULL_33_9]|uniref:Uncharacterized protein n=1 Tax=Candidatus Staskawiczbacteria bacterium RIFCSPLOWO2_01_FULL_33_9 TaxID=1802211 RepID=A0A1G2I6A1_9BACT|nr:MAG: hypothetical protein A2904_01150 [Candidatus Staskawiczbacteria bacterium RIFCSPLOWO2_01_FULL_33_9]
MEEEIVRKLKLALGEPIEKEKDVVYVLAEIRKLLEGNKIKSVYPILNFYCNWALHPEIDKTSSVRSILEKIEQGILSKKYNVWAVWAMIDFEEFHREMGLFLNKFDIVDQFGNRKYWENFRTLLVDILIDCPLKPSYGDIEEFRFIKSSERGEIDFMITFKNNKHIPMRGSFSFLDAEAIIEKHKKSSNPIV